MIAWMFTLLLGVAVGLALGVLVILLPNRKQKPTALPLKGATTLNLDGYPKCGECDETFISPVLLTMHIAAKHTPREDFADTNGPFRCDVCGLYAASFAELGRHWLGHREHPETTEAPQGCD